MVVEVEEKEGGVSGGVGKVDFLRNSLKALSVLANESNYPYLFLPAG